MAEVAEPCDEIRSNETYDPELFEAEDAQDFICGICLEIHKSNIVSIDPCGHLFGRSCLEQSPERKCPTCRTVFEENEISPAKYVERKIGNLELKCKHSDECDWKGTLLNFKEHVCPFELLKCRGLGCNHLCQRRQMAEHLSDETLHWKLKLEHKVTSLTQTVHSQQVTISALKRRRSSDFLRICELERETKRMKKCLPLMNLNVKTLTGRTIYVKAHKWATILFVKKEIERLEGIPCARQRLIFAGRQHDNDAILDACGFTDECTVHLVLRGPLLRKIHVRLVRTNSVETQRLTLNVNSQTTVLQVKNVISLHVGNVEVQRLTFAGDRLDDDRETLGNCGIGNASTLKAVVGPSVN